MLGPATGVQYDYQPHITQSNQVTDMALNSTVKPIAARSVGKGAVGKVVALKQTAVRVSPPNDWEPNCKYGLQRLDDSARGLLVRLEDVAAWLAQKMPRDEVIRELFYPLITDDGVEAKGLYVLSARHYAQPLIVGDALSPKMAGFWQYLPYADSQTIPEYVARDIAEEWCDAWPGLADPTTDSDWWHELVIRNNLERTRRFKADEPPLTEGPGFDTETRRTKMERLRRLAIRLEQAHALWDYGHVDATLNAPVEEVQKNAKRTGLWTDEQLATLLADFKKAPGKTVGARREYVAKQRGISAATVKKYVGKAEVVAKASVLFSQLGKRVGN